MALESASYVSGLNSSNPDNLDGKNQGDDHLRMIKAVLLSTFPGSAGAINRVQTKSGTYAPVVDDTRTLIRATGALALNLAAAATYGNGWSCALVASAGDLTVTPNGAELLNGANTPIVLQTGKAGFLWCDGSGVYLFTSDAPSATTTTDITGNETLTTVDHSRIRKITASAEVTLPASPRLNGTIRLKSYSTGNVKVMRNSGQTIDGAAADFRLPAYEFIELTYVGSNDWLITRRPTSYVSEVRAIGASGVPLGWTASGTAISRTTCAGLFAEVGTTYGPGDGSTTFDPPDAKGRHLIGAGTGTALETVTSQTAAGNAITLPTNTDRWKTGMEVVLSGVSGFSGLSNTTYWLIRNSATSYSFANSLANAQAGTAVVFTGTGSFLLTHTLTARPAGEAGGAEDHAQLPTELSIHTHVQNAHSHGPGAGTGFFTLGGTTSVGQPGTTLGANTGSTASVTATNQNAGGNAAMPVMTPYLAIPMMVKL